jgi:hypothetical protein
MCRGRRRFSHACHHPEMAVNLLTDEHGRYLVAPRRETHGVRNLRANCGQGALLPGKQREDFAANELGDDDKPALLRVSSCGASRLAIPCSG